MATTVYLVNQKSKRILGFTYYNPPCEFNKENVKDFLTALTLGYWYAKPHAKISAIAYHEHKTCDCVNWFGEYVPNTEEEFFKTYHY